MGSCMGFSMKALILYSSITGNTELVAKAFESTLIKYSWDCTVHKLDENTDLSKSGVYFEDFDLVLLGSPVVFSVPSVHVSKNLAMVEPDPPRLYRNLLFFTGSPIRPENAPLGVVFCTYSGESYGPVEALPTLDTMQMYLRYLFVSTVGRFACPGKKQNKSTMDLIAQELKIAPDEVAHLVVRYESNPDSMAYSGLSEDVIALLEQAVSEKNGYRIPLPKELENAVTWHINLDLRPNERDLLKAGIFLEEILEDYFAEDGLSRNPLSVYECIG